MRPAFVAIIEVTPGWIGKKAGGAMLNLAHGIGKEIPKSGISGTFGKVAALAQKKAPQIDRIAGLIHRKATRTGVPLNTYMDKVKAGFRKGRGEGAGKVFEKMYGPGIMQQGMKEFPNTMSLGMAGSLERAAASTKKLRNAKWKADFKAGTTKISKRMT